MNYPRHQNFNPIENSSPRNFLTNGVGFNSLGPLVPEISTSEVLQNLKMKISRDTSRVKTLLFSKQTKPSKSAKVFYQFTVYKCIL
jgi:hypothetical protein